jgi:hypothetical protein
MERMATFVERAPSEAIQCGDGVAEIEAPTEEAALLVARLGLAGLNERVEAAVLRAVETSPDLAERVVNMFLRPRLLFALGAPSAAPQGRWRIGFIAYVAVAGPRV